MSDRALQDEIIRALADAPFRASPGWRGRERADPDRMDRFARFLARHFYHERVHHFFKYSRALARVTGRRPEAVLRGPAFDAFLPSAVLGSRETASAVAALVVAHVRSGDGAAAVPYLDDLLRYEEAMMVVEAGRRVWREGDGEAVTPVAGRDAPELAPGTIVLELAFDLPPVLPRLLGPWTDVPMAPRQASRLLVGRTARGRVAVARLTEPIAAVLCHADGQRTLRELATRAGLDPAALRQALDGLTELGAVRFSTGS